MKSNRYLIWNPVWNQARAYTLGVLSMLAICAASAAQAQAPQQAGAIPPAALEQRAPVMVSVEAQGDNEQDVILTYAVPITESQVRADVAALGQSTGWVVDKLQITSTEDPYKQSTGKLYSAQFTTAAALDNATGHLPLAPIVTALRHYGKLIVLFDVEGPFVYRGNRSYHDNTLDIAMIPQAAGSGTYAFRVNAAPSGARLSFAGMDMPQNQAGSRQHLVLRLVASLLLALLVGGLAYVIIVRLMLRAEGSTGS